jgi:hypothetical protein
MAATANEAAGSERPMLWLRNGLGHFFWQAHNAIIAGRI